MDKRLLRYAAGGGAISLLACGLLCMALGAVSYTHMTLPTNSLV